MKRKLLLFIFSFFTSFLTLLSFFPVTNTAYAMNSNCQSFGTFGGLPGLSFTVTPSSVDKNHDFVATLTAPQSVIDRYIQKQPGVIFHIKGYIGGITDDPITNDNRLLRTTNGDYGGIFVPQNGSSGNVSVFRAQADTNPGTIRFYLFADSGDISIRDCIINTNTPSVTFTQANPDSEPAPECVGADVECDPSGVGASNLCVCNRDQGYECKPNASGENRCISTVTNKDTCSVGSDCFSGVCKAGKCDPSLTALVCEEVGADTDGTGANKVYTEGGHTGKFTCKTAFGTFSADPENFAQSVLRLLLGIAGGILLLLIIINGYKFMVSQGDPEKIKDAREGIIAAIAGILLIIFSLALLQLITVDILGIPGFS